MAEPVGNYQRIIAAINALRGQKAKEETAVSLLSSEQKASYDAVMAGRPGAALPAAPAAPAVAEPVDFFSFTQVDAGQLVREIADSIAAGLGGVGAATLGRIRTEVWRGLLNPQYTVALGGDVGAYTALRIRDWERQIRIFPTYVLEGERLGLIYSQMRANDLIDEAEYFALVREAGAPNLVDEWAFGVERDALSKLPRMMQVFSAGFDETGKKPNLVGLLNTAMQAEMQPNGPINTPASLFPKVRTPPEEDRLTSQFEAGVKTEGALGRAVDAALEAAGWSLDERAYSPAGWKAFEAERERLKDAALGMRDVNRGQDAAVTARQIADAITTRISTQVFGRAVEARYRAGEAVTDVNEADNAARDFLGGLGIKGTDVEADFFKQLSDFFKAQGVNNPASQDAAKQQFGAQVEDARRAKQAEAFDTIKGRKAFVDEWLDARGHSGVDIPEWAYEGMARSLRGLTPGEAREFADREFAALLPGYLQAKQAETAAEERATQAEAFQAPGARLTAAEAWLENQTGRPASDFRPEDVQALANTLLDADDPSALDAFLPYLPRLEQAADNKALAAGGGAFGAGGTDAFRSILEGMGVKGSPGFWANVAEEYYPQLAAALSQSYEAPEVAFGKALGFGPAFEPFPPTPVAPAAPAAAPEPTPEPFVPPSAASLAPGAFAAGADRPPTGTTQPFTVPPVSAFTPGGEFPEGMDRLPVGPTAFEPFPVAPTSPPPTAYQPADPATKRMVDRYREVTALLLDRPANWQALAVEQEQLLIAMYRSGAVLPTDIEAGRDAWASGERAKYEAGLTAPAAFAAGLEPSFRDFLGKMGSPEGVPTLPGIRMLDPDEWSPFGAGKIVSPPSGEVAPALVGLAGEDTAFQTYLGQQYGGEESTEAFRTYVQAEAAKRRAEAEATSQAFQQGPVFSATGAQAAPWSPETAAAFVRQTGAPQKQSYLDFFQSQAPRYRQAFEATPAFRERRQAETAQTLAQEEAERERRRQKALRRGRTAFV